MDKTRMCVVFTSLKLYKILDFLKSMLLLIGTQAF